MEQNFIAHVAAYAACIGPYDTYAVPNCPIREYVPSNLFISSNTNPYHPANIGYKQNKPNPKPSPYLPKPAYNSQSYGSKPLKNVDAYDHDSNQNSNQIDLSLHLGF